MADFTITVKNGIYPIGPDICTVNLWGVFKWGDNKWLNESTGSQIDVTKVYTNSISPSDDYSLGMIHFINDDLSIDDPWAFDVPISVLNDLNVDSSLALDAEIGISDDLSVSSETTNEDLSDGSGYDYVFVKPTINSDDRNNTTWTRPTPDTESWTSQSVATSWSEQ